MGEGAGEGLAGQAAEMTVLVKDVKARMLPEADDDFAKTASEFDTLAELRDDLRDAPRRDRRSARPRASCATARSRR